jgi:hypothetical protein
VGQHRALGRAGGPGRVHDERDVAFDDVDGRRRAVAEHIFIRFGALPGLTDDDAAHRRIGRSRRGQVRVHEQQPGTAVPHDTRHLPGGKPEVDRDRDGAKQVHREQRLDELGPIGHQHRNPVTLADPAFAQPRGQGTDAPV